MSNQKNKKPYVNPQGHIVYLLDPPIATTKGKDGKPRLKDGWRVATSADLSHAEKSESERAATEQSPKGGGPLGS